MKIHVDVEIVVPANRTRTIDTIFKKFAAQTNGWKYLEKESRRLRSATGEPSCTLLHLGHQHQPAVAVTRKRGNRFHIANIVPKATTRLSVSEFNQIAREFSDDLRDYVRAAKYRIRIATGPEDIGLSDIISSDIPRQQFELYLRLFPTSYHPLDIERLDKFTCAVHRYSRKPIDLTLLKRWLIEEKRWSEDDASWCVERIDAGLAVLRLRNHI